MNLVFYGILWLSFGSMHSLLTLPVLKNLLTPLLGRTYRIAYNLFAVIHFVVVYLIGSALVSSTRFTPFATSTAEAIFVLVKAAGLVVILLALRHYDIGRFSGLTQLLGQSQASTDTVEPLNVSGLNKWVRHPLYSGAFLIIWGAATSPFGLATAIFASVYLIIGTYYEERKLTALYGDAYSTYKDSVSAYFPRLHKL